MTLGCVHVEVGQRLSKLIITSSESHGLDFASISFIKGCFVSAKHLLKDLYERLVIVNHFLFQGSSLVS